VKGRDHLEDLSIDGKIIRLLERILNLMPEFKTVFIWHGLGVNDRLLWVRWWTLRLHRQVWVIWPTEPDGLLNGASLEPYEGHFAALYMVQCSVECELSSQCVPYLGQQQIRCQRRSASDSGLQMQRACKMTAWDPSDSILKSASQVTGNVKSRLNSWNACYQSVQNLLSSRWPSNNIKT
jgi:hypothetical protein